MTTNIFTLDNYPNDFAVSKIDSYVIGGTFFLDFSRPLQIVRWFIVKNSWIGFPVFIVAPVIHENEIEGGYRVGIHKNDKNFKVIIDLWKSNFPTKRKSSEIEDDGLKIIANFATQFPSDAGA